MDEFAAAIPWAFKLLVRGLLIALDTFFLSPERVLFRALIECFSPGSGFDTDVADEEILFGTRVRPRPLLAVDVITLRNSVTRQHRKEVRTLC